MNRKTRFVLAMAVMAGGTFGLGIAEPTAIAQGTAKPVAPNAKLDGKDDPEGRQKNRRVEITVKNQ